MLAHLVLTPAIWVVEFKINSFITPHCHLGNYCNALSPGLQVSLSACDCHASVRMWLYGVPEPEQLRARPPSMVPHQRRRSGMPSWVGQGSIFHNISHRVHHVPLSLIEEAVHVSHFYRTRAETMVKGYKLTPSKKKNGETVWLLPHPNSPIWGDQGG